MIKFLRQHGKKFALVMFVALIVIAYLVGILTQFLDNYFYNLRHMINGNFFQENYFDVTRINFSPFYSYSYLFKSPYAWFLVLVALGIAGKYIYKFFARFSKGGFEDKERGFMLSKDGTYGTARWLVPEELKGIAKVTSWKNADGYILGQLDTAGSKIVSTDSKSRLNKHIAVFGASGSGKSRCFSRNYIIQAVRRKESIIVTDPKGELYEDTAEFLRSQGYVVKMFNLVNPEKSDSWNCLKEIKGDELMAQVFADTVIKNTITGTKSDHFWDNSEMNLLKALILKVERSKYYKDKNKQNMGTVYDLLMQASGQIGLELLFKENNLTEEEKCCLAPYNIFKQAGENVRGGIILGLGTRLQVFQNEVIKKITSYDDIDLTLPGKVPCAYFCIMSDQDSTLNFLSTLFFSFLFIDLVRYADLNGGRCDVPVNFILDEFPNIGQIHDFTKKISTVRSRGINISVIFQAISQLQNRYPNGMWQEILGNCDTHLFLGCNDPDTAKFISDRVGEITIKVNSEQMSKKSRFSLFYEDGVKKSEGEGKRKLLTVDEVMRMPIDQCLIIFRGQNVLRAHKYDYSLHPFSKKFVKTYIRECPSIFEKEKIYMQQQELQKKLDKEKQNASNTNNEAQTSNISLNTGNNVVTVKNSFELKKKEKKSIFAKNNKKENQDEEAHQDKGEIEIENTVTSEDYATNETIGPLITSETKNDAVVNVAPVEETEEILVGEIIFDDNDIQENIGEIVFNEDPGEIAFIEPELNNHDDANVEKIQKFVFDKKENLLHNIEDKMNEKIHEEQIQPNSSGSQSNTSYLDLLRSGKNVNLNDKKKVFDPIFEKDFIESVKKNWNPGDVSKRSLKRKMEQENIERNDVVSKVTEY